mgnify:FL=1
MFSEVYENRLIKWKALRDTLETSIDPLREVVEYYSNAPIVHNKSINMWDQSTWHGPWELIQENGYTDTCILLGICYTLQLTERFSKNRFEIHIITEVEKQETFMLLSMGQTYIQPMGKRIISHNEAPGSWVPQKVYKLPALH